MDQTAPPAATPAATPPPAAPSSVPTTGDTQSASLAAAQSGDQAAYREARRAAQAGKPLPDVPATPLDPNAPRQLSRRQQKLNARIESSVDNATQALRDENARLKSALEARQQARRAEPPPRRADPNAEPEWKRIAAHPDAPRVENFSTLEEHAAAMSLFVAQQMRATETAAARRDAEQRDFLDDAHAYGGRLQAAAQADPSFVAKIPDAVRNARPLSGMSPTERAAATFANVVAEAAFHSDNPAALLTYLGERQPEALKIAQLHPSKWLTALYKLDGRLSSSAAPAPAASSPSHPKTLSDAPEAPVTLGSRPAGGDPYNAALKRGDQMAYRLARRAKLSAART